MKRTVTIHQPDFMPWLGFFNKISKVDEFVILDHVTNNVKDSAFWGRRVKMMINKSPAWVSVPLVKIEGQTFIPIKGMLINQSSDRLNEQLKTISNSYRKAPYFEQVFHLVEHYFNSESNFLSKRNSDFITEVLKMLNIDVKVTYSSQINPRFQLNEMLIDILQKCNATHYRCGMGAKNYQKDELFFDNNITVVYNEYFPKPYIHFDEMNFCQGLSIIDALMNLGFEETSQLIFNEMI